MNKLSCAEDAEKLFPFLKEIEFAQSPPSLVHLQEGTCILRDGEYGTHIPLVIKGIIRVIKISESGRAINLYRVNRGESCILLMSSALSGVPYPATAIIEEETQALLIPVAQFTDLMNRYESVRAFVCHHFNHRFIALITLIEEIVFKRMDQRLIEFILDRTSPEHESLMATHEEISLELGTAREVVTRLLKDLEKKNCISVKRGKTTVLARSELIKLIHSD